MREEIKLLSTQKLFKSLIKTLLIKRILKMMMKKRGKIKIEGK
mgnify:CR=1 FL=1